MTHEPMILIVDDDANLRKTLADILRLKGYQPLVASTGADAVNIAAKETPAVALIDLKLDDMSGLEALRRIREDNEEIACIVLTGHATQRSAIEAINLGAYSYVQKPYDVDQLLLAIRRATEKQEADAALRHSQALLRATGKMARVGGWEVDAASRTVVWTEELYEIHDVGTDYIPTIEGTIRFYAPDAQPKIRDALTGALNHGQAFDVELPFITAQGQALTVQIQGQPQYDEDRIIKVAGTFQDVTARKAAEQALRRTNRQLEETLAELHETQEHMIRQERLAAVGQLAAGLAHEYNNMMASIILYSDMMLRTSNLGPADRERVTAIYEQGRRAADLTQQILDFSRRAILRKQEISVGSYLRDLKQHLTQLLPEQIRVSLDLPHAPLWAHLDAERVRQALTNIALNARDAMRPEGGDLRITASHLRLAPGAPPPLPELTAGDWVVLGITDTGAGIAPDVLPHIWEPFFTTHAPMCSGLGLPQVLGIVKQHDGFIDVQTEVGQGTSFTIYLPAIPTARPRNAPELHRTGHGGDGSRLTLVIEAHERVREALVAALDSLDAKAVVASDVESAIDVAQSPNDRVGLILGDVAHLETRGVALIQELNHRFPGARIVMMGDQIPNRDIRAMVRSGAVRWLEKPLDLAKLAQVVAETEFDRAVAQEDV